MKQSEFARIINNLNQQIDNCEKSLAKYNQYNKNITSMPIDGVNKTISSCRQVQTNMDKFIKNDLYHIIGMGNLNAVQMSKLTKISKKLMSYRSEVKLFACMKYIGIPNYTNKSEFVLSSGVKLTKQFRGDENV